MTFNLAAAFKPAALASPANKTKGLSRYFLTPNTRDLLGTLAHGAVHAYPQ
ncbi:hypothetical protein [Undibacterium sp.]|uniref:hypothetical protein n=1 Tax=Undibacterium sp. TaxID=1914977 RepID=UPI002B519C4B|nr:hypothetical protein [Undibacterium sp.]HTD05899.1 hypothetical protein [Undibacterium sp.]